jgi:hypothetical protein
METSRRFTDLYVFNYIGNRSGNATEGRSFCTNLYSALEKGGYARVNFEQASTMSLAFMFRGFGDLLKSFRPYYLNEHILLCNADLTTCDMIRDVLNLAEGYYKDPIAWVEDPNKLIPKDPQ